MNCHFIFFWQYLLSTDYVANTMWIGFHQLCLFSDDKSQFLNNHVKDPSLVNCIYWVFVFLLDKYPMAQGWPDLFLEINLCRTLLR